MKRAAKKRAFKKRGRIVPKSIDFGFHHIEIEMITEAKMRDEAECQEGEYTPEGLWDTDLETIFLLKGLGRKRTRYYLMHEMVHASLDMMDSLEIGP